MNLCSGCLQKADIKVRYPHMLKVFHLCDGCKTSKKSFDVEEAVKQILITKGGL